LSVLKTAKPAAATKFLTALFFGPSKSGKTTLIGTAPKCLVLDTEGGTLSIRDTDAEVITIGDWSTLEGVVMELMLSSTHGYETVALDSVTLLQEVAGVEAGLLGAIVAGDDPRRAYGSIGAMIRHKILQLSSLPMTTIFTAQLRERDGVDIEAGQYPLTPDVTPSILKTLMAAPDIIGRTAIVQAGADPNDVEYRVYFGPETRSQVGQRKLGIPSVVKGLTIPKLISLAKEPV